MSWRTVVVSSSAKLDYQLGFMVIRKQDVVKIHISEISVVLIETTAVSLTAALLSELTKKKVKVIFCDEKRNPSSELTPYYGLSLIHIYLCCLVFPLICPGRYPPESSPPPRLPQRHGTAGIHPPSFFRCPLRTGWH